MPALWHVLSTSNQLLHLLHAGSKAIWELLSITSLVSSSAQFSEKLWQQQIFIQTSPLNLYSVGLCVTGVTSGGSLENILGLSTGPCLLWCCITPFAAILKEHSKLQKLIISSTCWIVFMSIPGTATAWTSQYFFFPLFSKRRKINNPSCFTEGEKQFQWKAVF